MGGMNSLSGNSFQCAVPPFPKQMMKAYVNVLHFLFITDKTGYDNSVNRVSKASLTITSQTLIILVLHFNFAEHFSF